ncbi:MAG: phosphatidate cytidylyltransferase [Chloroflexota bacterium]
MSQRLLSAAILIPLLLTLAWSYWGVVIIVCTLTIVGLRELYIILQHGGYNPRFRVGYTIGVALCLASAFKQFLDVTFDLTLLVLFGAVIVSLVVEICRYEEHSKMLANWALTLAGSFYIGGAFCHFILLRSLETPLEASLFGLVPMPLGTAWIYLVFGITWLQDTMAYLVGRAFGRHKLAPILSPKKTWEGAYGGMAISIIVGITFVPLFGLPIPLWLGALLGAVGGIAGPLGDLAESFFKRQVGLKDAGHLIPGHGGLLDRTDSLFFVTPVLFYCILLLT